MNKYEVYEKDGAVYIRGDQAAILAGQRNPNIQCAVAAPEKVVVIGGYVCRSLLLRWETV